jgi:hypothetical protein
MLGYWLSNVPIFSRGDFQCTSLFSKIYYFVRFSG